MPILSLMTPSLKSRPPSISVLSEVTSINWLDTISYSELAESKECRRATRSTAWAYTFPGIDTCGSLMSVRWSKRRSCLVSSVGLRSERDRANEAPGGLNRYHAGQAARADRRRTEGAGLAMN